MGWGGRCCCPGRRDLLCVLALLAGCLLPVCRTRVYTNHWAVKIAGGFPEANRIASKYGFINVGQIGALKDYYHFYHSRTIKRSVLSSRGTHSFISMEPKVEWIQQQVVKKRTKRDYDFSHAQSTYFNDPKWPSMWYMFHMANEFHWIVNLEEHTPPMGPHRDFQLNPLTSPMSSRLQYTTLSFPYYFTLTMLPVLGVLKTTPRFADSLGGLNMIRHIVLGMAMIYFNEKDITQISKKKSHMARSPEETRLKLPRDLSQWNHTEST